MRLQGVFFRNTKDIVPIEPFDIEFTHDELHRLFQPHDVAKKDAERLWSPIKPRPGATRGKKGVEEIYALVLDKDCGDVGELKACLEALAASGLAYFVHSSYSHMVAEKESSAGTTGPFDCFRVVLPLSRPISDPAELEAVYDVIVNSYLAPEPPSYQAEYDAAVERVKKAKSKERPKAPRGWDASAGKDIARAWFVPGGPASVSGFRVFEVRQGDPVDVDMCINTMDDVNGVESECEPDSRPKTKEGALLKCLTKFVDALAANGQEVEDGTPELDTEFRSDCPGCGSNNTLSISAKSEQGHITFICYEASCDRDLILPSIGLVWADLYADTMDAPERHMKLAFGSDRTEPYSVDELAAMAPIDERWILQTVAGYFIRVPGGDYDGPFIRDHVVNAARDRLAPAISARVSTTKMTKTGQTPKSLGELMHEYGQTPTKMAFSYKIDRSELRGSMFVQKTGRPVDVEPEFNEQIAKWLELFAGQHHESLLNWLATFLQLNRATCAIFVAGTSGAGKDLLIDGLAHFYGGEYTSVERATGRFNADLLKSPLVVANEELNASKDYGANPVDALKALISNSVHKIEQKHQHATHLQGFLRLVLATNKSGAFKLGRQPTESDLQALDERILLLQPPKEAKDYLISIGGFKATTEWVDGGGIARHVMWLRKNRQVVSGHRFLVDGQGGMSDLMSAEGKGSAVVLKAIFAALLGRQKNERVVRIKDGDVWLCKRALHEQWNIFSKVEKPDDMGSVWGSLTVPGTSWKTRVNMANERFVVLQSSVLEAFAKNAGLLEDLYEAFGVSVDDDLPE